MFWCGLTLFRSRCDFLHDPCLARVNILAQNLKALKTVPIMDNNDEECFVSC